MVTELDITDFKFKDTSVYPYVVNSTSIQIFSGVNIMNDRGHVGCSFPFRNIKNSEIPALARNTPWHLTVNSTIVNRVTKTTMLIVKYKCLKVDFSPGGSLGHDQA